MVHKTKSIKTKEENYMIMSNEKAIERRKLLAKDLRKQGFEIVLNYKDPRANGFKQAIEIGKGKQGEDWEKMDEHINQVEKTVKKHFPKAQFEYYRGFNKWLARFRWDVKFS